MTKSEGGATRIDDHPILGRATRGRKITLTVDGEPSEAYEGEPIAVALLAAGRRVFRYSPKRHGPRGIFCALGRCTDCVMIVDGQPNVRTCVTPARDGMLIETPEGLGHWDLSPMGVESDG
jgi:aerobic-type carbon monoxide dehydrogenase small subunit (CoxS/CutS family)